MNRTEMTALIVLVVIALAGDAYFIVSRCPCSPDIYATGVAVALLVQAGTASVPLMVDHLFHHSALKVRLRACALAVLAGLSSLPMMEVSILFGDSIPEAKWFESSGYTCEYSRLLPEGMRSFEHLRGTCGLLPAGTKYPDSRGGI
jgi:hypothetical protein